IRTLIPATLGVYIMHNKIYLKKSRISSIVLIFSVIICFISIGLGQIQAIADFNYTLHEMLYLPINIGIFLIPLEVLLVIYYFIRWIVNVKRGTEGKSKINILLILSSFLCLSLFILYLCN